MFRTLAKLIAAFVGMLGLRLDHAAWRADFVFWVVAFCVGGLAYGELFVWGDYPVERLKVVALCYAGVAWVLYYVGNSVVLGTPIRRWMQRRWGEANSRRYYNLALGIVFQHQGLAHGAIFESFNGSIVVSHGWVLFAAGALVALLGGGIKLWSTYVTSLDTYYYNDMFTGRAHGLDGELVLHGPYRWFKNPMYSVGNLQGYGSALMAFSWQGLVVSGIFHASLYGFYFLLERPFVKRAYAAPATES
jgi:hypothetical protein